jgi:hypothetical protein
MFDRCVTGDPEHCWNPAHRHSIDVEAGISVYSSTHFRADDETQPVGGTVIDTFTDDDGERHVKVVEVWRGRIQYHTLPVASVEPGMSGSAVNTRSVRSLLLAIGQDESRQRNPLAHMHARTVLAGVLTQHETTRRER